MIIAWGKNRGHEIGYETKVEQWVYMDDRTILNYERPCIKCGQFPTNDGHDACIPNLPNVKYACCGHGVECGYIVLVDGTRVNFGVNKEDEIVHYCETLNRGDAI